MQKIDYIEPAPNGLDKPRFDNLGFYEILWLIRDTGATNMMNAYGVRDVAEELGYDEFVDWMEQGGTRMNPEYPKLLQSGINAHVELELGHFELRFDSWTDLPRFSR